MFKRIQAIVLATRPWSFSMTTISVTLGSILALPVTPFHWVWYVLALMGMLLAHAGANVLNDYCDFRQGVDVPGAPTTRYRRHPLVAGDFTPDFILGLSLSCYAGAGLIGAYFFLTHGWWIVLFALLGGMGGIGYTAGPVHYKYRAMGEIAAFWLWGPLMMMACFFIQSHEWTGVARVLWVSVPQGLWVALVLLANNLTDTDDDRSVGVRTLSTRFGRAKATRLFIAMVAVIYLLTAFEILMGILPIWGFLSFLSIPVIALFIRQLLRAKVIPPDADPQTARAAMIYGIALIAAILLNTL